MWYCLVMGQLLTKQFHLFTSLRKKPFENIVGEGENAGNQHFLLFPKGFLSCKRQISLSEQALTQYHTMPHSDKLKMHSCGKHCEKKRNCL